MIVTLSESNTIGNRKEAVTKTVNSTKVQLRIKDQKFLNY